MSGWKNCQLGDIITFQRGHDLPKKQMVYGEYPVVGSNGIIGYHNEYTTEAPSITIGRSGNTGNPFIVYGRSWSHNTTLYVKEFKGSDPIYVYYLLRTLDLGNFAGGSAVPTLNRNHIHTLGISVPTLAEQVEIGRTLRAFDDKIANNTKINHHLAQMAQAIYAHAFPCGNNPTTPLGELIDVRDGTHDSPKAVEQGFPLVTSKHLLPFGVDLATPNRISKADFDKINERSKVDTHDILISMIGTIGLISLVIECDINFAIKNVGLFKTSQAEGWVYFVLCFLRSPEIKNHIDMRLAGSTQKYISLGELRQLPVAIPTSDKLWDFNDSVTPLFEEITLRTEESVHLATLRDTLLPRLISGELSVSGI